MGVIFESKAETIWEPGQLSGRLYYNLLKSLEDISSKHYNKIPCGVVESDGDTFSVDMAQLFSFIKYAYEHFYLKTNNEVLIKQLEPAIAISLWLIRDHSDLKVDFILQEHQHLDEIHR